MSIEKEVTYTLKVRADGSSSGAFKDASKQAKDLRKDFEGAGKAAEDMQRRMRRGAGGSNPLDFSGGGGSVERVGRGGHGGPMNPHQAGHLLGRFAGGGESGQIGSMIGRSMSGYGGALVSAGMLALSLRQVGSFMTDVANVQDIKGDHYLTGYEKQRGMVRNIPLVGGLAGGTMDWFDDFIHKLSGAAAQVRNLSVALERMGDKAEIAAQTMLNRRQYSSQSERLLANALGGRQALGWAGAAFPGIIERYNNPQMLSHTEAAIAANQALIDAQREHWSAQQEAGTVGAHVADRELRLRKASAKVGMYDNAPKDLNALNTQEKVDAEVNRARQHREALREEKTAIDAVKQAQQEQLDNAQRQGQALAAVQKGRIGLMREELSLLIEQHEKVKTGAEAFGGLKPWEQNRAVGIARRLKERGVEALHGDDADFLGRAGIFNELLSQKRIEAANKSDAFKEALGIAGYRDLATLEKERVKLQTNIAMQVNIDTEELNNLLAKSLGPLFRKLEVTAQHAGNNAIGLYDAQKRLEDVTKKAGQ